MPNCAALSFLVAMATIVSGRYFNEPDEAFNFQCPYHHVMTDVHSVYNRRQADRRWQFGCRKSDRTVFCTDSGYVNSFDGPFQFICPGNSFMVGFQSYNEVHRDDRKYGFRCCNVENNKPADCYVTDFVNEYHGKMTLSVPKSQAIKGAFSNYDFRRKDRVWKFQVCKLQ